jgi:predicted transposase/invertase (TIGR01784 family)
MKKEKSVLEYRDVRSAIEYAKKESFDKGFKQGFKRGIKRAIERYLIEIAQKCLKEGISIEEIAELTGLSAEQLKELKTNSGDTCP